jgi:hypothetical protein
MWGDVKQLLWIPEAGPYLPLNYRTYYNPHIDIWPQEGMIP